MKEEVSEGKPNFQQLQCAFLQMVCDSPVFLSFLIKSAAKIICLISVLTPALCYYIALINSNSVLDGLSDR